MPKAKSLRAIDLYSGVGGWSLGLRLAGIEVVASYERWGPANETNFKNNKHQAQTVDIRRLALDELPGSIDIVVGSPPCTQFSYSNRGGSGDLADGLQDIITFLSVVDHLKPRLWAMENVPRVASIIEHELRRGGCLARFKHLDVSPHIVNMEDFGLPQRRRRCIAGNFDFGLLETYRKATPRLTLGSVVKALAADPVVDPIYGLTLPKAKLRDHDVEDSLSDEEIRINRAAKITHPVYNSMFFPDRLDRSVRTITATCTRVSRESIVIKEREELDSYRRLTIRERASLQGFPVTFQFYGSTYAQKQRMVGNAIPPAFAYCVAQSFRGTHAKKLPKLSDAAVGLKAPIPLPPETKPDRAGASFPANRRFRFAIPSLRLKSGVRFELANSFEDSLTKWKVAFYFGTSKSIHSIRLDEALNGRLVKRLPKAASSAVHEQLEHCIAYVRDADVRRLQQVWSHNGPGGTSPFGLLDELNTIGANISTLLAPHDAHIQVLIMESVAIEYGKIAPTLPGLTKLCRNAPLIFAGLVVGSAANMELSKRIGDLDKSVRSIAARK